IFALLQEDSVVQIREDIIWPEPRFDRLLIPGVIKGPLCDKVVMKEVSPIVQQPHVSQGSVHMKDAVKEGNVTEEQASDAAFNTWSDGDMEVDGLEEQARDAAVNPRSNGDILKDRMDQLFSLVVVLFLVSTPNTRYTPLEKKRCPEVATWAHTLITYRLDKLYLLY
ncbi:hypothetical protein MKW92_028226, partial [Papaver armeniacum]